MSAYVPAAGDIVWLEFDPQAGHEQAGHCPALVLSNREYNRKTGLAIFCPITSRVKGYPFEVAMAGGVVQGVILADQIKSLDWQVRKARFAERVSEIVLCETLARFYAILE